MKNILKLILIFLVSFQVSGQNFVQFKDFYATKLVNDPTGLQELKDATDSLIAKFPTAFQSEFKVFDIGTYLHQEYTKDDGVKSFVDLAEQKVASQSPYYLLFGKESNQKGIYQKFWVRLKLPISGAFSCLSEENRNMILNNLIENVNSHAFKQEKFYYSEIEAIDLLKDFINKIVICNCDFKSPVCESGDFKAFDRELIGFGFRKKEIKVVGTRAWTSGEKGIFDYTGDSDQNHKLISLDGTTYYIPEQIIDSKGVFDSKSMTYEVYDPESDSFHDTIVNININGEVYILDNESYKNGEWDNAKSAAISKDFVEYWVILHDDNTNKDYLYSRYTFGALTSNLVTLQGDGSQIERGGVTLSPWGAALKVLGNAALEACMEAVINRFTNKNINTWYDAFKSVSVASALWSGISSLLPWQKTKTDMIMIALTNALINVIDKAIQGGPNYTAEEGIRDFIIGFGSNIATQWLGPKITEKVTVYFDGCIRLLEKSNNPTIKKLVEKLSGFCIGNLGCFVAGTPVFAFSNSNVNKLSIEKINLFQYVVAYNEISLKNTYASSSNNNFNFEAVNNDPFISTDQKERDQLSINDIDDWQEVIFEEVNGTTTCKLALQNDWIQAKNYVVDAIVNMNLPEQGVSGPFRIISIKHALPQKIPSKEAVENKLANNFSIRPVTGIFEHYSDKVLKVKFEGGDSLEVTESHPIYSKTAQKWQLAGDLEIGGEVLTYHGSSKIASKERLLGIHKVYNLEIKDLHNFIVGEVGVVVHNGCVLEHDQHNLTLKSTYGLLQNSCILDRLKRVTGAKGIKNGIEYENWLHDLVPGARKIKQNELFPSAREYDIYFELNGKKILGEAKAAGVLDDLIKTKGIKDQLGEQVKDAVANGYDFYLFSNTPISESWKSWLTKKGIKWLETLE